MMADTSTMTWSDLLCRFEDLIDNINTEMAAKEEEPPAELSGAALDDAVAKAAGWEINAFTGRTWHFRSDRVLGRGTFHPSEHAYDIAFAWACAPLESHQMMITSNGLWIKRGPVAMYSVTPLEASRIFVAAHAKEEDDG